MQIQSVSSDSSRVARLAAVAACVAVTFAATGAAARGGEPPSCSSTGEPYSLELRALTGPAGADLELDVSSAAGCAQIKTLTKVQLKTYAADGSLNDVRNLHDVAAPGASANIGLGPVPRDRRVEAHVLVKARRTHVLQAETTTRLRPDLVVTSVHAPLQTLTTRPIDVRAEVAEVNGDTAARATVTLMWGPTPLGTKAVEVPAGGRLTVAFDDVALSTAASVELSVHVSDAAPGETDATNNADTTTVDVSQHELARSRVVVPGLGGYGAQLNQHVFASITPVPPGGLLDLEAKVKALEPQLVRIFFHEIQEKQSADRMASFIETVALAQEAGATINITYHTAFNAKSQPDVYMAEFAEVLEELVRTRGLTNVRWVTVQNEPNTTAVTLEQYNALYRSLHAQLVSRGLRDQIGLMGGDLVESSSVVGSNHRNWFGYMAENMNDVLDAYSVHIYWNYWDIPRMEFRLRSVRQVIAGLPADAQKPTYITEFGVRGILNFAGKPALQPGYWQDGTPLSRTNVAAFQQLWFNVVSAQLGFIGAVKWDAYWGKYTPGYNEAYHMIGPASEGWPLFPTYHALRMLLQTTQRGWQVLGVEPWADDDWKLDDAGRPYDQPEQEIAAYAGPNGELTLMGLDTRGRDLNTASTESAPYSIGGLPPHTAFNLVSWNAAADGQNAIVAAVTTSAAGVARFEMPVHAAFALTTVPVS